MNLADLGPKLRKRFKTGLWHRSFCRQSWMRVMWILNSTTSDNSLHGKPSGVDLWQVLLATLPVLQCQFIIVEAGGRCFQGQEQSAASCRKPRRNKMWCGSDSCHWEWTPWTWPFCDRQQSLLGHWCRSCWGCRSGSSTHTIASSFAPSDPCATQTQDETTYLQGCCRENWIYDQVLRIQPLALVRS